MPNPVSIEVDEKLIQDAAYYALKVTSCSFKKKMRPRFGNGGLFKHMLGKIGEVAFFKYCMENGIAVKHTPFRDDYSRLNDKDDFIISIMGVDRKVEVKTASLRFPLPDNLRLYYNKKQYESKEDYDYLVVFVAVNHEVTEIKLLGWLHASDIADYPIRNNLSSPAYAIPLKNLKDMRVFVEEVE